jgi:hypothetical protein
MVRVPLTGDESVAHEPATQSCTLSVDWLGFSGTSNGVARHEAAKPTPMRRISSKRGMAEAPFRRSEVGSKALPA